MATKKKSIILKKIKIIDLFKLFGENYYLDVAYPVFENGFDKLKKIKGEFECVISQPRNLKHHCKLFAVFAESLNQRSIYELFSGEIEPVLIRKLLMKHKSEIEVLLYCLKWMFLPLEETILPDGEMMMTVSSISFKDMDQLIFIEFYKKCLEYLARKIGVKTSVLSRES